MTIATTIAATIAAGIRISGRVSIESASATPLPAMAAGVSRPSSVATLKTPDWMTSPPLSTRTENSAVPGTGNSTLRSVVRSSVTPPASTTTSAAGEPWTSVSTRKRFSPATWTLSRGSSAAIVRSRVARPSSTPPEDAVTRTGSVPGEKRHGSTENSPLDWSTASSRPAAKAASVAPLAPPVAVIRPISGPPASSVGAKVTETLPISATSKAMSAVSRGAPAAGAMEKRCAPGVSAGSSMAYGCETKAGPLSR